MLAVVVLAGPAFAEEENTVEMEDVPQAARDAPMANAMGVTFDSVQIDDDEGTETYEFSGTMEGGMMLEVDVLADGTVEEIEREITLADLPESVRATLEGVLPGFEPEFIEESTRKGGETVVYEFEGMFEGEEIDAEINADGTGFVRNEDVAG